MTEELPDHLPKPLGTNIALNLPHLSTKDPRLLITPEKGNFTKQGSEDMNDENDAPVLSTGVLTNSIHDEEPPIKSNPEGVDLIPMKLPLYVSDPTLDVTPEKLKTVLKNQRSLPGSKSQNNKPAKVRFSVPFTEEENEDVRKYEVSSATNSDHDKLQKEPFRTRAALYAQRNPLADITASDSSTQESTDNNSTNFESSTSMSSEGTLLSSYHEIADAKGPKTVPNPPLPHVKLKSVQRQTSERPANPKKQQSVSKDRIIVVRPEFNQSKLVDKATKQQSKNCNKADRPKQQFLKKNSSLQRHEHTVRYVPDCQTENTLSTATYHSTLSLGQKLQELKTDEFDAKGAVRKKMENSERFRTYVAEKTAEATNINPEENMYQNLVSVAVPDGQLLSSKSTKWKRLNHKPQKSKTSFDPEPNIWDFYYPDELYEAEPEYGPGDWIIKPKDSYGLQVKPTVPISEPSPLGAAEILDSHEQLWNGAWGRHLPQEADRIDVLP